MDRTCWCCGKPLSGYSAPFDGVCGNCGIEDTPLLELTDEGRIAADLYRMAEQMVMSVSTEPEPEPTVDAW